MNLDKLNEVLEKGPVFRKVQAQKAIFQDLIDDWSQAKTLPVDLREELNKKCPLKINVQATVSEEEESIKALIILSDGLKIETVLMRHKDGRNTVCVSSQVGCPLACSFCATGRIGFKRNLRVYEIIEQVLFFSRYLKPKKEKVTNIVFMGMGEPFLNYDNVLGAIRMLNDKEGINLGARHFSISTVGIVEGIKKLSGEKLQVNLAISLHAPDDKLRTEIMPINKKYPLREVLGAVDEYIKKTNRKVMIEYIMIKGKNDSDENAKTLAKLVAKPLYFVNLISCNPTGIFEGAEPERMKSFKDVLERHRVAVTQRHRFGRDIKAACGQLAGLEGDFNK